MSPKIILTTLILSYTLSTFGQTDPTTPTNTNPSAPKEKKPEKQGIGLGIKAGVNFASVTNASDINASKTSGFMIGAFFAPGTGKQVLGFRTEFIYSKQGYDFSTASSTGSVKLDYILMPQLMTINITKYFEIHAGFQMAYLLSAKADSTKTSATPANPYSSMIDYFNRFDYGIAAGVEVHPILGLMIGARYNLSLNNMYKMPTDGNMTTPPGIPSTENIDFKNNVVQLYAGWKF